MVDWLFTLKGLDASAVTVIKTNAGNPNPNGNGNEVLTQDGMNLLKAVHDDTIYDFLIKHQSWIASTK